MKNQFVLIMTDSQRRDMLGCYGNPDMATPGLDGLAGRGLRFEAAYTAQPVCGPARSALFTGLYPHANGSWGNSMALSADVRTVGQRLRDSGLRHTAYIGKWHLDGGDYFGTGVCPGGWDPDSWYDMRRYLEELTPAQRIASRSIRTLDEGPVPAGFTFANRCTERALLYIRAHRDDDFFLVVSYDEPHDPFLCPEPYASMYRDYVFPMPENARDTLEGKPAHHRVWAGATAGNRTVDVAYYFGCNAYVDHEISRVLDALGEQAPDAAVFYTSDHGISLQSHRISGKGAAMYEEITGVPLMAAGPGFRTGVCGAPVSHIDLTPTVLDYFGAPQSPMLQGKSLLPALRGDAEPDGRVFIEFSRYEVDHDGFGGFQPIRCVRDGRYKLVVNLLTSDELYDLEADPGELVNRIEDSETAAARNRLHNALLGWMNETRDPFRGYCWETRPWRADACAPTWSYTGFTRQKENEDYEPRQLDYDTGLEMVQATRKK